MFRTKDRRLARYSALLAVPFLIALLAACSTGGGGSTPEKSAASEQSFDDWQISFASCMRGEGIDMPDPTKDGLSMALPAGGEDGDAMMKASETCMKKVGEPPAPPGGKKTEKEMLADQLKIAKCFRDNGFDVPDPKAGQGFTIPDAPEDVMEKCGFGGASGGMTAVRPIG